MSCHWTLKPQTNQVEIWILFILSRNLHTVTKMDAHTLMKLKDCIWHAEMKRSKHTSWDAEWVEAEARRLDKVSASIDLKGERTDPW